MNVVFLDYDGVVNTPMLGDDGSECCCYPDDNKVNNFRAVQLVSDFCLKYDYSIVVSSSWRLEDNYKECLINGGLREGITILGKTPFLDCLPRSEEIWRYLSSHAEIQNFLIFDDDPVPGLETHLILCDPNTGFGVEEFQLAEQQHKKLSLPNCAVP